MARLLRAAPRGLAGAASCGAPGAAARCALGAGLGGGPGTTARGVPGATDSRGVVGAGAPTCGVVGVGVPGAGPNPCGVAGAPQSGVPGAPRGSGDLPVMRRLRSAASGAGEAGAGPPVVLSDSRAAALGVCGHGREPVASLTGRACLQLLHCFLVLRFVSPQAGHSQVPSGAGGFRGMYMQVKFGVVGHDMRDAVDPGAASQVIFGVVGQDIRLAVDPGAASPSLPEDLVRMRLRTTVGNSEACSHAFCACQSGVLGQDIGGAAELGAVSPGRDLPRVRLWCATGSADDSSISFSTLLEEPPRPRCEVTAVFCVRPGAGGRSGDSDAMMRDRFRLGFPCFSSGFLFVFDACARRGDSDSTRRRRRLLRDRCCLGFPSVSEVCAR
mmetsp:Transcript_17993/g.33409  ORF Transcript_17993/g.33409 Transcript_17993/m.33409 type:complete len:385 (-) Transcript_17993:393-1547(-)